jgi:hypothetical protein
MEGKKIELNDQDSLLTNIKIVLGEGCANGIDKISNESSIYVLYVVDINEVTEKSLRIQFASYHAKFPDRTWEQFLKFKKNWDEDKYSYVIEPQGYFIDEDTAVDYAKKDMGGINEAGAYPYIIVSSMPLNRVYPVANFRRHRLFHFNDNTEQYEEIDWDYNEGTKLLGQKADNGWY